MNAVFNQRSRETRDLIKFFDVSFASNRGRCTPNFKHAVSDEYNDALRCSALWGVNHRVDPGRFNSSNSKVAELKQMQTHLPENIFMPDRRNDWEVQSKTARLNQRKRENFEKENKWWSKEEQTCKWKPVHGKQTLGSSDIQRNHCTVPKNHSK